MSASPGREHMNPYEFGPLLRQFRTDHEWSLRDLGNRIQFSRSHVGKVEQGEKFPDRQLAELADASLSADGKLVKAWERDARQRAELQKAGRLLTASVDDSLQLIVSTDERLAIDDILTGARGLAVRYLSTAPAPMLQDTVELRSEILRRLRSHHYKPSEVQDLYTALGHVQGVLSYAALDLGDSQAAMTHAKAAFTCAEHGFNNELQAWVRGTQSLVARFQGDYDLALRLAQNGLQYPAKGTAGIRLLCGVAQCWANLGNSTSAHQALDDALHSRDQLATLDPMPGLFEFTTTKQHYYAGSSLIWLDGQNDAERAAREATEAIRLWQGEPAEKRSLDDEALAHVYAGTAHLQRGELDQAVEAVRQVLDLPAERQISWIKKRMDRFASLLRSKPYQQSSIAHDLHDEIQALAS